MSRKGVWVEIRKRITCGKKGEWCVDVCAVFEGGGMRGIGLVGGVIAAQQHGVVFRRVAGTSAGAIVAMLLAAGYRGEQIQTMIPQMPFRQWTNNKGIFSMWGSFLRLIVKKGLYCADPLEQTLENWLKKRHIQTFDDLPSQSLRVIASDISQGKLLVLPDDIAEYGIDPRTLSVARAVRMSASIPYFFDPVICTGAQNRRCLIVDGGLLSNYPLWIFDDEMHDHAQRYPVLGFRLVGQQHSGPRRIHGPISMLHALFQTMLDAQDERYIQKHQRFRTIKIPAHAVSSTQFDLSASASQQLLQAGYEAGQLFFQRWSYAHYHKQYEMSHSKIQAYTKR
jgi:NTE family protein